LDLDLCAGPIQNEGGVQIPAFGFGLRLLPLTGANCQREESLSSQGSKPRIRNSVLHWRCLARFDQATYSQTTQRRVKDCQRILSWHLHSDSLQSIAYQWDRLILVSRKKQHLKAKVWQAYFGSLFFLFENAPHSSHDLLKLDNALIQKRAFLKFLGQLLFRSSQPLPLRILVNDHDVVRLSHVG